MYRSEREVAELLQTFEKQTNAFRHQVNGVSIWQLVRFPVAIRLQNFAGPLRSKPILELLVAFVQSFNIWTLAKTLFRTKVDFLFFSSYSGLRLKHKNKVKDIAVDDYVAQVPGSAKVIIWNAAGFRNRLRNALIKPDYNFSGWPLLASLIVRAFPSRQALAECELLAKDLREHLGLSQYSAKALQRTVRTFLWNAAFYRFFLRIVKPKVCLVPDTSQHALMFACQSLGIKYIELQHGFFARSHPEALPLHARQALPNLLLPNVVALYGPYWKTALQGSLVSELGLDHAIGNPTLEHYREIRKKRTEGVDNRVKMVLTTNGMDKVKLARFIEGILRLYADQIILTIKLHPAYDLDEQLYRSLEERFPESVKVLNGSTDPNTFELIAQSDLHLSISSSCHYDALSIGTPTAVLALESHELVLDLVEGGHACLLSSPNQMGDLLSRIRQGDDNVALARQEEFCRNSGCLNLIRLLNK
jgi:hypothetical protein